MREIEADSISADMITFLYGWRDKEESPEFIEGINLIIIRQIFKSQILLIISLI